MKLAETLFLTYTGTVKIAYSCIEDIASIIQYTLWRRECLLVIAIQAENILYNAYQYPVLEGVVTMI